MLVIDGEMMLCAMGMSLCYSFYLHAVLCSLLLIEFSSCCSTCHENRQNYLIITYRFHFRAMPAIMDMPFILGLYFDSYFYRVED